MSVVFIISPIDLIPDVIPVVGWMDRADDLRLKRGAEFKEKTRRIGREEEPSFFVMLPRLFVVAFGCCHKTGYQFSLGHLPAATSFH